MLQKQLKAGTETGSLMNHLMSANNTMPRVGEGCTELCWTDRHAHEVVAVSEDGTVCVLAPINAVRVDKEGYYSESQDYNYDDVNMNAQFVVIYKNGAWKKVVQQVVFTKEMSEWIDKNMAEWRDQNSEIRKEMFGGKIHLQLVAGKSKIKTTYDKISLLFGVKKEYRDPCF